MINRLKRISGMIETTNQVLVEKQKKKEEALKSPLEREVEKMREEIHYLLKACDDIKIEWGYLLELKEQEREIVSTQVKDIKLFDTGILIETPGEGERYIEGSTYDLGELEGHSYKVLDEIEEEGEETFYIVAKDLKKEEVERKLFLEVVPYDPGKGRRNIFIDIYGNWATIEVLSKSMIYKITATINPEKVDFLKVNTSTKSISVRALKEIDKEDMIGENEAFLESLKFSNVGELAKFGK